MDQLETVNLAELVALQENYAAYLATWSVRCYANLVVT